MKTEWNCYMKTRTGRRHNSKGLICQDRVGYKKQGSLQAIALADGIGETNLNIIAGEMIVQCVVDFMLKNFYNMKFTDRKDIAYSIIIYANRIMNKLSKQYNMDKIEFSSTILAVCLDNITNQFFTFHLGDGIILTKNDKISVFSYPENGYHKNQTFLTSSYDAVDRMRITRGKLDNSIRKIAIMSDGMYRYPVECTNFLEILDNIKYSHEMLDEGEDDRSIAVLEKPG